MLLKSTPEVDFTNILQATFSYKSVFAASLYLQLGFVIFGKIKKAACKMLVKFTPRFYEQIFCSKISLLFKFYFNIMFMSNFGAI